MFIEKLPDYRKYVFQMHVKLEEFILNSKIFQQMFRKPFIPPLKNVINMFSVCWVDNIYKRFKSTRKTYH